jgi:hypothetical protein
MPAEATLTNTHTVHILQAMAPGRIVELLIRHWALLTIGSAAVIVILVFGLLLWKIRSKKTGAKPKATGPRDENGRERIASADYQLITERILQIDGKYKSVLFAAAGLNCLPITIPVNVAIQLAEQKKRCLLIDLDLKRDAIAKAFNLAEKVDPKDLRPKPYKTPFEHLLIWPGHNFTKIKQMNIKPLAEAAIEKFDWVLINAPYLDGGCDRTQIASAAQCSIIFTQNTTQAARLAALMKAARCKLIGNIQVAAEKS